MMGRAELHAFFRKPNPKGNQPEGFIAPVGRSKILAKLIAGTPKDARILEVGCSVGRNLAYLADEGYTRLEGVEISSHATQLLRDTYPQLKRAKIHTGAAEDILPLLKGPYDLIFTMAFLSMVHPDSIDVFDEIGRLTDTVLAIEPMIPVQSSRHYPHDLGRLFEERGMNFDGVVNFAADPEFAGLDTALDIYGGYWFHRV